MRSYRFVGVSVWLVLALSLALLLVSSAALQGVRTAHAEEDPEPTVEGQVIGGNAVANGEYPFIVAFWTGASGDLRISSSSAGGPSLTGTACSRRRIV